MNKVEESNPDIHSKNEAEEPQASKPFTRKIPVNPGIEHEDHSIQDEAIRTHRKKEVINNSDAEVLGDVVAPVRLDPVPNVKPKTDDLLIVNKTIYQKVKNWIFTSPTRTITIGFALTILIGGFLLCLPLAAQTGEWTPPVVAFFTATSATCVTGLVVVDTATYWSYFGQFVIIALIQIGGLGIVTIMSFFMIAVRRKVKFKTMLAMQESTGSESFVDVKSLVRKILSITFTCEIIGGSVLSWRFSRYLPLGSAVRRGFFHAVSAFCNAGFDLMGDFRGQFTNLNTWNNEPIVLIMTALLIITGGLGFVVWTDVINLRKTHKLHFHSKLVLGATAGLLIFGTIVFALLEWNNSKTMSMGTLPLWQRPTAAFFQSATLRTAGFNSIDQVVLTQPSKVISIVLMFIGAGPASTGGGIKNTTFAVIVFGAFSFLRGKKNPIIGRHKLSNEIFIKSFVVMFLGVGIIGIATFLLLIFERNSIVANHFDFVDLMFEATSAFATVGNSTTPTVNLTMASWITLIPCMYLGRVGPASFAMSFNFKTAKALETVYPDGKTFVG